MNKANDVRINFDESHRPKDWEIINLEKLISRFPEIVEKSMLDLSPQLITTYLINLAREFNSFYTETKILDEGEFVAHKLNIVKASMIVLRNGLNILGIRVPDKM